MTVSEYPKAASISKNFWLVSQLTKRDFMQRYKGTFLGILWPVLYSLLFLTIFSFVFTVVLSVRWGTASGSGALMIFCGLVPHLFIAEVMGRSPTVILGAANFVKKVIFPVQLLPVVAVNSAFALCIINIILLIIFSIVDGVGSAETIVIMMMLCLPLYLFALGLGWLLSSVGVYFRDISQIAPVLTQLMMFMAPVFYPIENIPENIRTYFYLNPLTYFVEAFRDSLHGTFSLSGWLVATLVYALFALGSMLIFRRLRVAFGDLL
jgi:lipopolysaccharide transport system permease protein